MALKEFIIANVHLVDPAAGIDGLRDLHIAAGHVKAVLPQGAGADLKRSHVVPEIFDATGFYCAPGLVDVHTHLREPGFEYKETIATGTKAAVTGGFTSVLCMANTNPVNDNAYVTKFIVSQAKEHGVCRVYPVGAASKGLQGEQLAEIGKMHEAGIVAVSDDGMPVMNSYLMRKVLDYTRAFNLPVISHAEDKNLVGQGVMHEGFHSCCLGLRGIPAESEEIMVARDISLTRLTRGRLHLAHMSGRYSIPHIKRAKEEGLPVTAEVTPHHLIFCDEDVSSYDSNFKMAPPLRSQEDIAVLRQALRDGIIDCIATDHAPHAPRDKDVLFEFAANGVVGLETAWSVGLELVQKEVLTLSRLVEVMSTNPARIAGIPGGTLKAGSLADLFLWEPRTSRTLSSQDLCSRSKNSPFVGRTLQGKVVATLVGGEFKYLGTGVPWTL